LNIIAQSSDRLNKLIEEILTVSRIQRGTLQLNKELFSPGQSLQNIRDMMEPVGKSRNVALVLDDQWPASRLLNGDQQRMDQVLTNVISNAVKFSNNDTTVTIRSTLENNEWCVVVSDQGIGIPAADLPRLFQRFFRAQTAKEAQIQGTGLGLYVCKAIVEGHGGDIAITSQVGVGTTVTFHVPLDGEGKTLLP
jgi:signal transduction histidine kinase